MSRNGLPPGIRRRHARSCPAHRSDDLKTCRCRPCYQAQAGPRRSRQTRTWSTLGAAVSWKRDTDRAFARGELTGDRSPRLREAAEDWLEKAEAGIVRARGDKPYRPSTLRGYRQALTVHVLDSPLGNVRLDELTRGRLNRHVESLQARGLAAQTVKNAIIPLRAIYRRAFEDGEVQVNPTFRARVPAGSGRRMRFLVPREIGPLLDALEAGDRTLWATAIYAGLRRGELMALRWTDVDLGAGIITVTWSYDKGSGTTGPVKSAAGQDRRVPIIASLRDHLTEHRQLAGARPTGLVFARDRLAGHSRAAARGTPFSDTAVANRAHTRWASASVAPVTLHDCRHTFASLMIAAMANAGTFNPKTLQDMLGHASITQTYDRYGHLFPGAQQQAGRMLDEFLATATSGHAANDEDVVATADGAPLPSVAPDLEHAHDCQADVPHTSIRRIR